ncbi:hypothetical protein FJZ36_13570 [Candidatus Poribacteria bacterium]|nr:hypothetical protein [Candidatus Poribacteria bacterium]
MPDDRRTTLERAFSNSGWLTPWDRLCVEFGCVAYATDPSLLDASFRRDAHYVAVGNDILSRTITPTVYMITDKPQKSRNLVVLEPSLLDNVEVWRAPRGGMLTNRNTAFIKTFWSRPNSARYDDRGLRDCANLKDAPLSRFRDELAAFKAEKQVTKVERETRRTRPEPNANELLRNALASVNVASEDATAVHSNYFRDGDFDAYWSVVYGVFHPDIARLNVTSARDFLTRSIALYESDPGSFAIDVNLALEAIRRLLTTMPDAARALLLRRIRRPTILLRDMGAGGSIRRRQVDAYGRLNAAFERIARELDDRGFSPLAAERFALMLGFVALWTE